MTLEHVLREYLTKNDTLIGIFRQTKICGVKCFHKFDKSPNQNICIQTLSKFARFPTSGDKVANMATLLHEASEVLNIYSVQWECGRITSPLPFSLVSLWLLLFLISREFRIRQYVYELEQIVQW